MNYFCTYCDQGYAARMLCLYQSLKEQDEPFQLLVLCFDAETEAVVATAGDASLVAVPLAEVLVADPAYAAVRGRRSRVEFYFTATPVLVRHCFVLEPAAQVMTYLDADLFFFSPASLVFEQQGNASVGIVPHRFIKPSPRKHQHGLYNVGWVSFRRDANGMACLEWWRERCLEWCHDRVENGRFADQGYLNEFPTKFAGVCALEHPGINAAPWNIDPTQLACVGGKPWMNGHRILFYHYQGIREIRAGWFDPGVRGYHVPLTPELREYLYLPYLRRLTAMQAHLRHQGIVPSIGYKRVPTGYGLSALWERFRTKSFWFIYRRLRGKLIYRPEPSTMNAAEFADRGVQLYILLPVHNRREITLRFVEALTCQTWREFHLVLIDDGSSDGTAAAVKLLWPAAEVITGNGNWWWAGCLDQGCKYLARHGIAEDDILVLMNDDVMMGAEFFEQAIDEFRTTKDTLFLARQVDLSTHCEIDHGGGIRVDLNQLRFHAASRPAEINCMPTRGLFLRWRDMCRIGGFHPKYLPHYLSDYEFTLRAQRKGLHLRVARIASLGVRTDQSGQSIENLIFRIEEEEISAVFLKTL